MADPISEGAPTGAPQPDIHIATKDGINVEKPASDTLGVVIPAPEHSQTENKSEEKTSFSAKPGERSPLNSTVNPVLSPDTRTDEEIDAARTALDKHSAEIQAGVPKPFSEPSAETSFQAGHTTPAPTTTPATETPTAPVKKSFLQTLQFWNK